MAVESATYINGLNGSLPNANDEISEGDDHIRLIKNVLKNTFPNISAAVNASAAEMNTLVGLVISSYMRTLLDDADAATARATLGAVPTGALTSSGLTMTSSRLLGRTTSGSGAVEELTVSGNLQLSGGVLSDTGASTISSSTTLTAADVGKTLVAQGSSAITITLPQLSAVPVGATILVLSTNTNSAGVTVQRQGSDVITASSTNASLISVVLRDGDSAVFVKLSASTWLLLNHVRTTLNADGAPPMYACRAWVNFDGTTTPPTIRASGNVSSVVRNGTGDYTVNFSVNMPNTNYCAVAVAKSNDTMGAWGMASNSMQRTISSVRFTGARDSGGNIGNSNENHVIAFG